MNNPQGGQSNFSYALSPLTLTPNLVGIPQSVNTGLKQPGWCLISNESPYQLQIQTPSTGVFTPCPPQTVMKLQLALGDTTIYITPIVLLPQAAPSSVVNIQVYQQEPPGTYPMELTRQAAPTSGAAKFGYSVSILQTVNSFSVLAVFNPLTSHAILDFFSIRSSSNSAQQTQVQFLKLAADPGYTDFSSSIVAHDSQAPTSTAKAENSTTTSVVGLTVEIENLTPGNQFFEFCNFPDHYIAHPGEGYQLLLSGVSAGTGVILTMKWTEQ
jgi:hypothetical protein